MDRIIIKLIGPPDSGKGIAHSIIWRALKESGRFSTSWSKDKEYELIIELKPVVCPHCKGHGMVSHLPNETQD